MALSTACRSNPPKTPQTNNLLYTSEWKAVTDLSGSSYSPENIAVSDSLLEVSFTLKKKEEDEIVFIELVCSLNSNLSSSKGLEISYKCDTPLLIKLSQSDFGNEGDRSYAHYQYMVPASETLNTVSVNFKHFTRPLWTPRASKGKAMKLEHINAIYLTPKIDAATGGSAALSIKGLYLQ